MGIAEPFGPPSNDNRGPKSDSLAGCAFGVGNGGDAGKGGGVGVVGGGVGDGSDGVDEGNGVGDEGEVTSWANRFIASKITKSKPRIRSLMRNVNGIKQERSQHLGS
jgi:hypothetical protein